MNKLFLSVAAIAIAGLTSPALACDKTITVHNHSSHTIIGVYSTESGESSWGENLLTETIPPGYEQNVDVNDDSGSSFQDLRAQLRGGGYANRFHANVCTLTDWTITD